MELNSFIRDLNLFGEGNMPLEELISKLEKFQVKNENVFDFAGVNTENLNKVIELLFKIINKQQTPGTEKSDSVSLKAIKSSLGCLRIISRSKECVYSLSQNEKYTASILSIANINESTDDIEDNEELQLEALRIISNCLFHSNHFRQLFIEKDCAKHITNRLAKSSRSDVSDREVPLIQVKVLFLISALENKIRGKMHDEYNLLEVLVKMLEECLKRKGLLEDATSGIDTSERATTTDEPCKLTENEIKLFSEIFKTLFNITVDACENHSKGNCSSDVVYKRLLVVLHCLLTKCLSNPEIQDDLIGHVAHMMVNIPKCCLSGLIPSVKRRNWEESIPRRHGYPTEYELRDMSAIITLVITLDNELKSNKKQQEGCSKAFSILTSLCHICRYLPLVRKYLRFQILPPLKDASVRPELSDSFKGRLVKLMTHVDTNTKNMAADFLFVLCKENVDRLVKYTGYGNAAGLLASRGLMGGKKAAPTGDYSSDDSDSETEEYNAVVDKIDVMTGAVAEKSADDNPLKGMTDEEKQTNAEEVMSLMEKLTSMNIVKPMKIGEDGRPHEVSEDEAKEYLKKKIDSMDK